MAPPPQGYAGAPPQGYAPAQQQGMAPPGAYQQPQYPTTTVVTNQAPNCPHTDIDRMDSCNCLSICCAVFFFPAGLCFLPFTMDKRCRQCGTPV